MSKDNCSNNTNSKMISLSYQNKKQSYYNNKIKNRISVYSKMIGGNKFIYKSKISIYITKKNQEQIKIMGDVNKQFEQESKKLIELLQQKWRDEVILFKQIEFRNQILSIDNQ
ncbi:unnamed protein product [Paramecium sonneborni]|nr:unnamed protein product [Paramecium sonneborni]